MLFGALKTVHWIYRSLGASHWPRERLQGHQFARFRRLVTFAHMRVPMYQKLYREHGFHPGQLQCLDDLQRIPILEKNRLKSTEPGDMLATGVDPASCRRVATSGSTGAPLQIYLDSDGQAWHRATAWRILFEHGFRWRDRTMEIRMAAGETSRLQSFGIAPKDWVSILEPPSAWVRRLLAVKPEVLVAGAGTLHALAEAMPDCGGTHRPRLIFSDSETLYPETRALVERKLGSTPVDVYGLVELSNFAWQCELRRGFHISADTHIVENRENTPMIVTDLGLHAMPLIRYQTGDFADPDSEPCPCGRTLPLLSRIHGRAVDSIALPSGRRLFWPFFHEVLGACSQIRQWRVVHRPGQPFLIRIAACNETIPIVEAAVRSTLPEPAQFRVESVESFPEDPTAKLRLVQTLPPQ